MRLAYAAETRRFEIERFWQRTLFFWKVLAGAFIGYASLAGKDRFSQLVVSCFGIVASLAWTLQNRGAKYWHEAWEQKTKQAQMDALGEELFSRQEPLLEKGWFGAARFSVTKLAIILSDYTVLVWAGLTARALIPAARRWFLPDGRAEAVISHFAEGKEALPLLLTALFVIIMFVEGRSTPRGGEKAD